jgi:nitrogen regulatory protein P-II 1
MKTITAVIRAHMLDRVLHALERCEHFPGVTISACHGESRGRGTGGAYRAEPGLSMREMARLELYCRDEHGQHLVDTISKAAHTGNPGDGVIAVTDLAEVLRIRSGEHGDAAV